MQIFSRLEPACFVYPIKSPWTVTSHKAPNHCSPLEHNDLDTPHPASKPPLWFFCLLGVPVTASPSE